MVIIYISDVDGNRGKTMAMREKAWNEKIGSDLSSLLYILLLGK
jgi:hypothetical protein